MKRVKDWAILVLGLILVAKLGVNVVRLVKTGEKVKEAQKQLDQAESENAKLRQKLAEVQSPAFMEQQAREKLGLAHPDETVIILPKVQNSNSQIANKPEANWQRWYDLYIGI